MNQGIEIIYQGVLHDYTNNLYGCPDLLIRIDRINSIFNKELISDEDIRLYQNNYNYVIVDIKHSTLNFSQNNINLINSNNIPKYKGQLLIYTKLLNSHQMYQSKCAFIIGKNNDIGVINYNEYDLAYNSKINKAIEWIRRMRTEGHKWTLLPKPSCSELYPNMKNTLDSKYSNLKKKLSIKINEITNIWQCGYKKRLVAHNKHIYSWKNKKCNSLNLGFKPSTTSNILDNILRINRQKKLKFQINNSIDKSIYNSNMSNFYIDYETINGNIGQQIEDSTNDFIFMIGVGWEENNNWCFKNFILEELNNNSELELMNQFWNFINSLTLNQNSNNLRFYHWSQAEPIFYNKFLAKHDDNIFPKLNFYDLHEYFLSNNIVVKDAFNFSLKTIANAMYKNKLIKTCWDTSNICSNGLDAMYFAYNIYKTNIGQVSDNGIMQDISNYNMIDTKVMWEILKYIRTKYL
jgi:hypothetical protein